MMIANAGFAIEASTVCIVHLEVRAIQKIPAMIWPRGPKRLLTDGSFELPSNTATTIA